MVSVAKHDFYREERKGREGIAKENQKKALRNFALFAILAVEKLFCNKY